MPRNPKQKRSKAMVDAIIEAGFICVAKNGMAATTTRQIAKVAGVGIGSVYEYFKDKEAIYTAMLEIFTSDLVRLITEITPRLTDESVEGVLRVLLYSFKDFLRKDDARYLRYAQDAFNGDIRDTQRSINKVLIDLMMQYFLRHPELAKVGNIPGTTYFLLHGGAYAVMNLLLDPSPTITFDELVDAIAKMVGSYAQIQLSQ